DVSRAELARRVHSQSPAPLPVSRPDEHKSLPWRQWSWAGGGSSPARTCLQTATAVKNPFQRGATADGARPPALQAPPSRASASAISRGVCRANVVPQEASWQNWRKLGIEAGPTSEHPRSRASLATIGPLSQREGESSTRLRPRRPATVC